MPEMIPRRARFKKGLVNALLVLAAAGVVCGYWGIWVLVAYWAPGLTLWGNAAVFFTGPVSLVAGVLAWIQPRQRLAAFFCAVCFTLWLVLWGVMFVAGFRFL